MANWLGESTEREPPYPEEDDDLTKHLAFLDRHRWHLYKYADERLSGDARRKWSTTYPNLNGWCLFADWLREQAISAMKEDGSHIDPRAPVPEFYLVPELLLDR